MDGAFRVVVLEVAPETDVGELVAVHLRQPPEGREFRALKQDDDGAGIVRCGNRQTKAVRGGMNNPVALKRCSDQLMVKAGLALFQVGIGFGGAMSHDLEGKMVERRSNKCAPLDGDPVLSVPGTQDNPVPERS